MRYLLPMRAVIQRVSHAEVSVKERTTGSIGPGLLVFLGIEKLDTIEDRQWLAGKLPRIRCFEDEAGRMNQDLHDIDGGILVISQFTLYGSLRKGSRPSFNRAAEPEMARRFYESFLRELGSILEKDVACGVFGAEMKINALNDGPVTLIIDTRNRDF